MTYQATVTKSANTASQRTSHSGPDCQKRSMPRSAAAPKGRKKEMFRRRPTVIMRALGVLVQQISVPIVKFCAIAEFHMVLLATLVPPPKKPLSHSVLYEPFLFYAPTRHYVRQFVCGTRDRQGTLIARACSLDCGLVRQNPAMVGQRRWSMYFRGHWSRFYSTRSPTLPLCRYAAQQCGVSHNWTSWTGNPLAAATSKISLAMFSAVGLSSIRYSGSPNC